jgi:hypothetical protein
MKRLEFDYLDCFVDEVIEKFADLLSKREEASICVIAKYAEIKYVVEELIMAGYEIGYMDIEDKYDYSDEYICFLDNYVGSQTVCCEKIKFDTGAYKGLFNKDEVIYVLDNCSSVVLSAVHHYSEIYEVGIVSPEDKIRTTCDDCCDEDCDPCMRNNIPAEGRSNTLKNESVYKINGKPVDKDTFEKEFNNFEKKLNDMCHVMFECSDIMQNMGNWLRMLR